MEKEYPPYFRSGQTSHTAQCSCGRKKREGPRICQICMDKEDFGKTFQSIQRLEAEITEKKDTLISQVQIQTELEEQLRNIKQLIDMTKLQITISENKLEEEKERIQLSSETVSDDARVHTGNDIYGRTVLLETHCSIVRLLGSQENVYFGHVTLVITIYGVREYRWHYGVVVKNELPINLNHYFWKPDKNKDSEDNLVKTFGDFPHIPSDTKLSDMMKMHFKKCFTVFDKKRWPTQVWDKDDKFGNETAIELVDRLKQQKIKMYQKKPNADSASLQEELAKAEKRIEEARKIKKEQRKKERDVRNQEIDKITKDRETQAQLAKDRETLEMAQLPRDRESLEKAPLAKDRESLEKAQKDKAAERLEQSTRDKERENLRKEQENAALEQAKIQEQNATLSSKKKRPKKPTQSTPVVDIDQIALEEASAYNKAILIEKANETIKILSEKINTHTQVEQALVNLQIEDVNSVQEAKSSILDLLDNYYKYRDEINQRINELDEYITDYNEEPLFTLNNIKKYISTSIDRLKSLEKDIIIKDATAKLRRLLEDIQSCTEEEKTLGVLPIEEAHSSMYELLAKYYKYRDEINQRIKLLEEKRYVDIDLYKELISANATLLEAIQPLDYKFRFVDAKLLFIRELKNRADYIKTGEDKLETLDPATLEASNVRRSLINEYYKYNTAHNQFIDEVMEKNMPEEYKNILYKDAYDLKETANVTKRLAELIPMEIHYIRKMYENFSDEVNEDDNVIIGNLAYLKLLSNEEAEKIVKDLKMRKQAKGKGKGKGKGKDIFFSTKDIISAFDK